MNIIFDCRFIRVDHHDGISRFTSELFTALAKLTDLTALVSDLRQLEKLPEGTRFIKANDPTDGLRELFIAPKLNKLGATHVFSPMQTMGSFGRRYKLILTLHDLIYYSHPRPPAALSTLVRLAWRLYHLFYWPARLLLNRADLVVTVSNTSKMEILRNKLTKREVVVVYNAADSEKSIAMDPRINPWHKRNALIYMGSFMDYKNVECLVRAMTDLPGFELILLSKVSEDVRATLTVAAGSSVNQIVFRNGVSDEEYSKVLAGAFALVSASKAEGFGIPLVEAMNYGLPLVISDIPIFREVAADAGFFFDPLDPQDFARKVLELSDETSWLNQSSRSIERAKAFNWDSSARALLESIRRI